MDSSVKIGIAFSGGGAKGAAHLGVMKVFEKYGIQPACITGASIGAIIGSALALGLTVDEIIERSKTLASSKFTKIKNFNLFSESLIKDDEINAAIIELVDEKTFTDTKIPFACNAIDLESGEEVLLKEGKLWEATRASAAIPFIFNPMFLNGRYLVDGSLLNNVPVDHLREMADLDLIIGVELGGMTSRQYISAMVWNKYYRKPKSFELYPSFLTKLKMNTNLMAHILLRSLDITMDVCQKVIYEKAKPDLIIKPNVASISMLDFSMYKTAYQAGIVAAEEAVPTILELMNKVSLSKKSVVDVLKK